MRTYLVTAGLAVLAMAGVLLGHRMDPAQSAFPAALAVAATIVLLQVLFVIRPLRSGVSEKLRRVRQRRWKAERARRKAEADEHAAEAALELTLAARRSAEDTLGLRAAFLASMTHDLRTPLNGIIGISDLLSRTPLAREQADLVRLVREAGLTLLDLIGGIVDITRIEDGRLELDETPFVPLRLLEQVATVNRLRAEGKGLYLATEFGIGLERTVIGDPVRLRQIVQNLVSNALKATREGGVTVTANLTEAGGRVLLALEIADTGPVQTEAELAAKFEAGNGPPLEDLRRTGGGGLGLAIARNLCRLMRGRLSARSTEAGGNVVRLDLLLEPSGAREAARAEASAGTAQPSYAVAADGRADRVLRAGVLGASDVTRRLLDIALATELVDAVDLGDGAGLVPRAAAGEVDLVLVDLDALDAAGFEVLRALRAAEDGAGRPRLPVAALAHDAAPLERIAPLLADLFDGALGLPVRATELAVFLDRCRERPSAGLKDAAARRRFRLAG